LLPSPSKGERLCRQAGFSGCHGVWSRAMALRMVEQLAHGRGECDLGGLAGGPEAAEEGAQHRVAAHRGDGRHVQHGADVAAPPPWMKRRPRWDPLSRLIGATPARAAIWRRLRVPSSGSLARKVARVTGPTPGTEASRSSLARHTGLVRRARPMSRSSSSIAWASQSRWSSRRGRSGGASWRRRTFSAARISTSWRRRATRSIRAWRAASGRGRGGGLTRFGSFWEAMAVVYASSARKVSVPLPPPRAGTHAQSCPARDPAMRAIVGREGLERLAASSSQIGRFETEWLASEANPRR
jgi:hypothetical protein